jgi:cobalt/nickel transport system permease protein
MRHYFFDRYSRLDSPIHRVSAEIKLSAALVLLLSIVAVRKESVLVYVPIAFLLAAAAAASRVPPLFLVRRVLFLEPFVAGIAVLTLFQPNGTSMFFFTIAKSTLCLCTIVLLSNTTPFSDLLELARRWHFPTLMVSIIALMYRYVFVLVDEMERMQRARASRTFIRQRRARWMSISQIAGQLFIRSTERAERIYAAMCARGWK